MTEQPELHDLTKFLVDRMKTYPEEFFHPNGEPVIHGKWFGVLDRVLQWGAPQDKEAVNTAFTAIVMDKTFQQALKTLLAPEESADSIVGQSFSGIPVGIPSGYADGVQGSIGVGGGPSLTQQQAQALMQTQQVPQVRANSVTISPNVARAMGLKPPTVNETFVEAYERIKKRLGL